MAKKYTIPFKSTDNKDCVIDIYIKDATGDVIELVAGANPFVVEQDRTNSSVYTKGIIDTYYTITAWSQTDTNLFSFASNEYGDVHFKYYENGQLLHTGILNPFESGSPYLQDGMYAISLSAESGIKNLKDKEFRADNGAFASGKITLAKAVSLCLKSLHIPNEYPIQTRVGIETYVGSTKKGVTGDFFTKLIDAESFKTGTNTWMSCFDVLEAICSNIFDLYFDHDRWVIDYNADYLGTNHYIYNFDSSGTFINSTSGVIIRTNINASDLRGTESFLFSKKNIKIAQNIKSVKNSLLNGVFEASGFDILNWTNESSFASSVIGGTGTVDNPFYFRIDGSVYGNPSPVSSDTQYIESTPFNWNPYGTIDFLDRESTKFYDTDERLKLNLNAEVGSGINGHRVQVIATFQNLRNRSTQTVINAPSPTIVYDTVTLYLTNDGWSTDVNWYITGSSDNESIEVPAPSIRMQQELAYKSLVYGFYDLETPPTVSIKIRLFRGDRKKIGTSTNEESGYIYQIKYYAVGASIWAAKDEALLQGKIYDYYTSKRSDRRNNDTINSSIYNPVAPYAYGSIYDSSDTNTPIDGFKRRSDEPILTWITLLAIDYLKANDSRLVRMDIDRFVFSRPSTIFLSGSRVFRAFDYSYDARRNVTKLTIVEVKNSGSTVQLKTTEGNYTDIETTSTPRTNDLVIGDNLFSVRNKVGLQENLKGIKTINQLGDERLVIGAGIDIVESLSVIAPSGGKVTVSLEDTENDYTQIKPAASGTYALEEWVESNAWMLGGNALTSAQTMGSISGNFDITVLRNNVEVGKWRTGGLTVPALNVSGLTASQLVATDANDNLVSLGTATYPSLTELTYLKGVTSAIQAQINAKFTLPSLINGSVLFSNGTTISQDNANFFWDNTNKRLGLGTPLPATTLDVRGQVSANLGSLANPTYSFVGDLNTGMYSPSADALALVTGGVNRVHVNNVGSVGIGTTGLTGYNLRVLKNITGAVSSFGITSEGAIQNDVTTQGIGFLTNLSVAAAPSAQSLPFLLHNRTLQGTIGANVTVGTQVGYWADASMTGATNNYGFRGAIASATGRWNLFMDGSAQNHFRGKVGIGAGSTVPTTELDVLGITRTTNLRITSGATVGRYWVCTNADGTGAWQTFSDGYLGTWNASTNTPTIANGTGTTGQWYRVVTAGTWNSIAFSVGDDVRYNGSIWQRIPSQGFTLQIATSSVLGGIRVGSGLSIDAGTGLLSVASLATPRNIAISGDLSWNVNFNGSADVTAIGTLATVNSNTGTFAGITVNGKGLVTDAVALTTLAGYGITNAYTQAESDGRYVDFDTPQNINAVKSFFGGLEFGYGGSLKPQSISFTGGGGLIFGASVIESNELFIKGESTLFYSGTSGYAKLTTGGLFLSSGLTELSTPTERLHINGSIRYNVTLKPNNQTPTAGMWLKAPTTTTNEWAFITHSDISNLSDYTGFDSRYFTEAESDARYQPLDGDLTSIAGLSGTSGLLRKTAANTWTLDTTNYLNSSNLTSFVATTSQVGVVSVGTTMEINGFGVINQKNGIVTAGTYRSVTVDTYGRVTAGTNPTTLAGYGITNAQPLDQDLTYIAALVGSGYAKRNSDGTWSLDNNTFLTANQTITLTGIVTGSGTTTITTSIGDNALTIAKTAGLQAALDAKQNTLPSGTAGQILTINNSNQYTPMNLEINPLYLKHKRLAVGTFFDNFGEMHNLTHEANRYLRIGAFTNDVTAINIGIQTDDTNGIIEYVGLGDLVLKSQRDFYIDNFKGGGIRNLAVNNAGKLITTTGGGAGTSQDINSVLGIGNVVLNNSIVFKGGSPVLSMYNASNILKGTLSMGTDITLASSGVALELNGDTDIRILASNTIYLGASNTSQSINIQGTNYCFSEDALFQGSNSWGSANNSTSPQTGDIQAQIYSGGRWVPLKLKTINNIIEGSTYSLLYAVNGN